MVRRQAKAINFGIIYGISAFGLANNLRITRDEAKNFIDTYFEQYPGIQVYMDATTEYAKANGFGFGADFQFFRSFDTVSSSGGDFRCTSFYGVWNSTFSNGFSLSPGKTESIMIPSVFERFQLSWLNLGA